jgi:hypothetical protein
MTVNLEHREIRKPLLWKVKAKNADRHSAGFPRGEPKAKHEATFADFAASRCDVRNAPSSCV